MNSAELDKERAMAAATLILGGREPSDIEVMVTLEYVVALVLVGVMGGSYAGAARMLNEALVPGVEARLALGSSRRRRT